MDEWITAIKKVSSKEYYESDPRRNFHMDVQGNHSWYVTNHARPTFCNVCHNALGSVMNNGLSCEGKNHLDPFQSRSKWPIVRGDSVISEFRGP